MLLLGIRSDLSRAIKYWEEDSDLSEGVAGNIVLLQFCISNDDYMKLVKRELEGSEKARISIKQLQP